MTVIYIIPENDNLYWENITSHDQQILPALNFNLTDNDICNVYFLFSLGLSSEFGQDINFYELICLL